ncbi:MAG: disulfide bond formation protein B [Gammaproteobacteria bacterium]|nr:disulfide bond formation protein B [Gammaproteobacteria bacterium]
MKRDLINRCDTLIGVSIPAAVLLGALIIQVFDNQQPCPLCLLQRCGFIAYAIAMIVYLKNGYKAKYLALAILAAVVGGAVSVRQILLHITSPQGFSIPILSLHLYTWAFIAFVGFILYSCALLMINRPNIEVS